MKRTALAVLATLACVGTPFAQPPTATTICLAAIDKGLQTHGHYDGFQPTEDLERARALRWDAPYGRKRPVKVATLVMVEGLARHRADHGLADEVTIKCGLNDNRVVAWNILPGHGHADGAE